MNDNVYALLMERLKTALANLPRCRVRADALKLGMFIGRLAPRKTDDFALATTIQDNARFQARCGKLDSNGKTWTRQRIRSCRDALVKIGFIEKVNEDTICYWSEKNRSFRDTPNRFRFGPEYGALLALPADPETPSVSSKSQPSVQLSPLQTPAIRAGRIQDIAPLVVVVKDVVVMGRVRSDIIRSMVAKREAARIQHRLPMPMPLVQTAALAGMKLSAAAASIFNRRP